MNPETPKPPKRRLRRFVVVLVCIIGALGACFLGLVYYASPELIGLRPTGITKYQESSGEHPIDFWVRFREEWSRSAGTSSQEVYRFVYSRSFNHNDICVSAWQDGERYWIRTAVLECYGSPPAFLHCERTRSLPAEKWKQIQAMFAKPSVIDPPGLAHYMKDPVTGEEISGWDGADWILESVVDGQTKRLNVFSPIDVQGTLENPTMATITPGFEDFVEACKQMLKHGRVTVREMY